MEVAESGTASEAMVVGPATVAGGGKAAKARVELGSGSSSSFSYEEDSEEESEETVSEEESEEMVSEMRSEVGLGEAGPVVEPEVRPVDPLIVQFGEDDGWWRKMVDFVRQETEGDAGDPLDCWQDQTPQDEVQVSGPHRDASRSGHATAC